MPKQELPARARPAARPGSARCRGTAWCGSWPTRWAISGAPSADGDEDHDRRGGCHRDPVPAQPGQGQPSAGCGPRSPAPGRRLVGTVGTGQRHRLADTASSGSEPVVARRRGPTAARRVAVDREVAGRQVRRAGRRAGRPAPAPRPRSAPAPWDSAGGSGQPGGRVDRRRHVAGEQDPLPPVGEVRVGDRARPTAGPPCTGGAGGRTARRAGASSTIWPRYITATRSLTCRTTDRSCEMNTYVSPSSRLQVVEQVDDLRLDRDVERRHRLVADDQLGPQRERAGHPDALALAAGELGREAVVVLRVEPDELHQLLHRAAAARGPSAMPWIANGSPMIEPTRRRGFSEPYGSWKIICMSRRIGASCAPRQPGDVPAVEDDPARGEVVQPGDAAGQGGLAAPGLPDQAERLAAAHGQADAVDRVHRRAARAAGAGSA